MSQLEKKPFRGALKHKVPDKHTDSQTDIRISRSPFEANIRKLVALRHNHKDAHKSHQESLCSRKTVNTLYDRERDLRSTIKRSAIIHSDLDSGDLLKTRCSAGLLWKLFSQFLDLYNNNPG